jgi:hypothetical protein
VDAKTGSRRTANWVVRAVGERLLMPLALGVATVVSAAGAEQLSPDQGGPNATAAQGQAVTPGAKSVNPSSLPEQNQSQASGLLPPPRPRGGVSEQEYNARKAAAAKGGGSTPSVPLAPSPSGEPPSQK